MLDLFDLTGKVALVTGASKGLGKALARGLAKAGADLALCARNLDELQQTKNEIEQLGVRAEIFQMDVLNKGSIQKAVLSALGTFKQIDILVNNAGINVRKPVLEIQEAEWDQVLNTNLKGYFLVAQAVVPNMIERQKGKVINMASILGAVGLENQSPYASSKGGVIQLTKVMALEWARHHITCQRHRTDLF